jgi:hypothetical protein
MDRTIGGVNGPDRAATSVATGILIGTVEVAKPKTSTAILLAALPYLTEWRMARQTVERQSNCFRHEATPGLDNPARLCIRPSANNPLRISSSGQAQRRFLVRVRDF